MVNLKTNSSICDLIKIKYEGPGYYSGTTNKPLQDDVELEKIAEVVCDKEDVYQFCRFNGYKFKPFKIMHNDDIPSHWEIINDLTNYIELEDNY